MAKNSAFLFYPNDFLVGTLSLSFEERGKYITLLCHMHRKGRIKGEDARMLVGNISDTLNAKFIVDDKGYLYNPRLEIETNRRDRFIESRRNNARRPSEKLKIIPIAIGSEKSNLSETNKSHKPTNAELNIPLVQTPMQKVFRQWVEYRKRIRKPLKEQSLEGAFNRLQRLSNNDPNKAELIVQCSIDNGYQGLFPIKENEYKQLKTITEQWLS